MVFARQGDVRKWILDDCGQCGHVFSVGSVDCWQCRRPLRLGWNPAWMSNLPGQLLLQEQTAGIIFFCAVKLRYNVDYSNMKPVKSRLVGEWPTK